MSRLPNIHPGEVLLEEFMKPMGLSQYRLANEIGVPIPRINAIVNEQRGISADTALRLAKYLGTSAKFWLGLQCDYDLEEQETKVRRDLDAISRRRAAR